eukprot:1152509-Pelagomonas_calceolata.AAC.8
MLQLCAHADQESILSVILSLIKDHFVSLLMCCYCPSYVDMSSSGLIDPDTFIGASTSLSDC